jgi:hypothetical protein
MQILFTVNTLVFLAVAMIGMVMHAVKKWADGDINGNLIDWYLVNPRATVRALLTCLGGLAGLVLTGVAVDWHISAQIVAVWGVGYGADTLNNQSVSQS